MTSPSRLRYISIDIEGNFDFHKIPSRERILLHCRLPLAGPVNVPPIGKMVSRLSRRHVSTCGEPCSGVQDCETIILNHISIFDDPHHRFMEVGIHSGHCLRRDICCSCKHDLSFKSALYLTNYPREFIFLWTSGREAHSTTF